MTAQRKVPSVFDSYSNLSSKEFSNLLKQNISDSKRMEIEFAREVKFNKLKAKLWETAAEDYLSEIELIKRLLHIVGTAFDVSKVTYHVFFNDINAFKPVARWRKSGEQVKESNLIPAEIAKIYYGRKYVELPKDLEQEHRKVVKEMMIADGEKSLLIVPFSDDLKGTNRLISFCDCEEERDWGGYELSILFELVKIIAKQIEYNLKDRELKESIQKFQMFVENSNNLVFTLSPDGAFTYLSPKWNEFLGYNPDELIGQSFSLFVHPDDISSCWEVIKQVIKEGQKLSGFEYRAMKKSGEFIWHATNASPLRDRDGNITSFLGISYDINDRVHTERLLQEERKQFYNLIENTPGIIAEIGFDGIISFINRHAELESGYTKEELQGRHFLEAYMFQPEDQPTLIESFNRLIKGEEIRGLEVGFNKKNEEVIRLEINAIPTEDRILVAMRNVTDAKLAEEKLKQAHDELEKRVEERTQQLQEKNVELNQEINERKDIEEELRRSQQMLQLVIENIPQFIFWKDRNSVFLGGNKNFSKAAGYKDPEDLIGKTDYDMPWTKEQADDYVKWDKKVMDSDQPEYHIIEAQTQANGNLAWLDTNKVPLHNQNNEVIGIIGTFEDITEKLKRNKESKLQEQKLIQADKMISLGILVAGIAHEINNPNQFIMSHLSPLKRAFEGTIPILDKYYEDNGDFRIAGMNYSVMRKKFPGIFDNIMEGSKRIKNIVEELREYIREFPSEHTEQIQFNSVVQSALTLMANLIKKTTSKFNVEYSEDLPALKGHYQRLEQVVINLVQNACQALSNNSESICIKTAYDRTYESIILRVIDEGKGIPRENIDRVTDLFFTTKRDIGGIGLGLAISSKIILEHGGKLAFTPNSKKGTVATVVLPVNKEEKLAEDAYFTPNS